MLESDVNRRPILTSKVDPRAESVAHRFCTRRVDHRQPFTDVR